MHEPLVEPAAGGRAKARPTKAAQGQVRCSACLHCRVLARHSDLAAGRKTEDTLVRCRKIHWLNEFGEERVVRLETVERGRTGLMAGECPDFETEEEEGDGT